MLWRSLPTAPEYQIAEDGTVVGPRGHIRRQRIGNSGYLQCSLYGGKRNIMIHRYVALAFLGSPPSTHHEVAHNDGNKLNNHYSNLRWATCAENHADKHLHGTAYKGYGQRNYYGPVFRNSKGHLIPIPEQFRQ